MSLLDLWKLVKRFWWLVIGFPMLFAACFYIYTLYDAQKSTSEYAATGDIVVSMGINTVAGIAKMETEQIALTYARVSASCSPDYNLNRLTITVKADNRDIASEALAGTLENIVFQSRNLLKGVDPDSDYVAFDAVVNLSDPVAHADRISKKMFLLAPIAGLVVALLVIVIIFLARRPILGVGEAEVFADAPVLDSLPLVDGRRLVTNAGFLCNKPTVNRFCLIPVGSSDDGVLDGVARKLSATIQEEDELCSCSVLSAQAALERFNNQQQDSLEILIACCNSLRQSIDGARVARESDVTILLIRQWADSLRSLEAALSELQLAGVSSIGLIYQSK